MGFVSALVREGHCKASFGHAPFRDEISKAICDLVKNLVAQECLSHRRKSQLRLCPGETSHRERSGLTTTCGCLFGFVCKKKPTQLERFSGEESSQRAPPFFCGWREYKLD